MYKILNDTLKTPQSLTKFVIDYLVTYIKEFGITKYNNTTKTNGRHTSTIRERTLRGPVEWKLI